MKKTVMGFSVAASLQEDGFRYLGKGQSNYALKAHSCASIKGINPDKINHDSSSRDDEPSGMTRLLPSSINAYTLPILVFLLLTEI
mmetsp:Transcript_13616/g.20323  ORF Transcript_13616/g.20323 Transcript_13616/m.20323 type:complete len:86 (+) Transcript_13616:74-331(+)